MTRIKSFALNDETVKKVRRLSVRYAAGNDSLFLRALLLSLPEARDAEAAPLMTKIVQDTLQRVDKLRDEE